MFNGEATEIIYDVSKGREYANFARSVGPQYVYGSLRGDAVMYGGLALSAEHKTAVEFLVLVL